MLTDLQKRAAQSIINIFETGKALGDYGNVTLMAGDSGHLTYGRSQTTLASGNLFLLIKDYCKAVNAVFASQLNPYLDRLENIDLSLDHDQQFRQLLHAAGADPVMHAVQDSFFDRVYWTPAINRATSLGITSALGSAVIYDSRVHGSLEKIVTLTNQQGTVADLGENDWISSYVDVRRNWLATHSNALLHKTVYRMDAFRKLITDGNWTLALPFTVRGIELTQALLSEQPVIVSAHDDSERILSLRSPMMSGDDVLALQQQLIALGFAITADGKFGANTRDAVVEFQKQQQNLKADGIVGPATRSALMAAPATATN